MRTIVVFEGADRAGKTTALKMFNRATDYRYTCIDRLFVSSAVYDKKFKRTDCLAELHRAAFSLSSFFNVCFVLVLGTKSRMHKYYRDQELFKDAYQGFLEDCGNRCDFLVIRNTGTKRELLENVLLLADFVRGNVYN